MSTSSVRISVMVMSNDWRSPSLLAKEAATLDWLSNGRFELGIGAGLMVQDYERLGIPYDAAGVRVERLLEALPILRDLLGGKTVTHSGKHYRIKDASCLPRPAQSRIPLVVGGGSRKVLRGAGEFADIANIHTNLAAGQVDSRTRDYGAEMVKQRLDWVREGAHAGGADRFHEIELSARVVAAQVTDTRAAAAERLGAEWGLSGSELLASPYALVGSIDSIMEDLIRRRDELGFSYVLWNEDQLDALAPVVRRLAGR